MKSSLSASFNKRKANSDDDLIPLINIVFLLLIFFMVAGQIRAQTAADLKLPIANHGKEAIEPEHRLELNANLQLFFDGEPITVEALNAQLTSFDRTQKLTLFVHRHLTAAEIQPLLSNLRAQQITSLTLLSDSEGS